MTSSGVSLQGFSGSLSFSAEREQRWVKKKEKKDVHLPKGCSQGHKAKNTSVLGGPDEENTAETEVSSTCLNCIANGRLTLPEVGRFPSCRDTSTFCVQCYKQPGCLNSMCFPHRVQSIFLHMR